MKLKILTTLIVCILSLFTTNKVDASMYFNEEFDSELTNQNTWVENENGGSITFDSNSISLASTNTDGFPFFATSEEVFPSGDFSIEWKFQYLSQDYGTGIAITDVIPENRTPNHPNRVNTIFSTWPAVSEKIAVNFAVCDENNPDCINFLPPYISDGSDFYDSNTIKIDYINKQYYVYYNNSDEPLFVSSPTDRAAKYIWFGNPIDPATPLSWSSFKIDYIHITDLSNNRLGVKQMFQNDEQWKDLEYDSATSSAGTSGWIDVYNDDVDANYDGTFGEWGCAVTSAAMVLDFNGFKRFKDGTELTPYSLDRWLNSNNGYQVSRDGAYLKWDSISELSEELYDNFKDDVTFVGKKLKLVSPVAAKENVVESIDDGNPSIVRNSGYWGSYGHFFVAEGYNQIDEENVELLINDPMNEHASLPAEKSIIDRKIFLPMEDDEQYRSFRFMIDNRDLAFWIEDGLGRRNGKLPDGSIVREIPDGFYSEEGANVVDPRDLSLLEKIKNTVVKTAYATYGIAEVGMNETSAEVYHLFISSEVDDNYVLDLNVSRPGPDFSPEDFVEEIGAGEVIEYVLDMTNDQQPVVEKVEEEVTFESIRKYIVEQYEEGNIYKESLKRVLLLKLQLIERFDQKGHKWVAQLMLNWLDRWLIHRGDRFMTNEVVSDLSEMLGELKEGL